jgi:SAM-dependent methyltransferase
MPIVAGLLCFFAKTFQDLAEFISRLSNSIYGLLPLILSSSELVKLIQETYVPRYESSRLGLTEPALLDSLLAPWELGLLNRYGFDSGRMLVMGAGLGRESIAIARRGTHVVGIDTNPIAMQVATRYATAYGIPATFHRADFLRLPYHTASFDFAFLTTLMYSSIPGRRQRQAWLKELGRLLRPGGLLFVSFVALPAGYQVSRAARFRKSLNRLLAKLPGTNQDYQIGDECMTGHFLHEFQNETELREELKGADVNITELNWSQGYAAISFAPHYTST